MFINYHILVVNMLMKINIHHHFGLYFLTLYLYFLLRDFSRIFRGFLISIMIWLYPRLFLLAPHFNSHFRSHHQLQSHIDPSFSLIKSFSTRAWFQHLVAIAQLFHPPLPFFQQLDHFLIYLPLIGLQYFHRLFYQNLNLNLQFRFLSKTFWLISSCE